MSSDIALIEALRADIDSLMGTNKHEIASVLIHYQKQGRTIYEILQEPGLIVRLCHPRVFVGNYPCKGGHLDLYVGKRQGNALYYKVITDEKDKKI